MARNTLLGCVGCLLLASIAWGQTKVLTLKDGRQLVGEVTKTADGYQIVTDKGVVVFPADQVQSVEDYVTPEDEYRKRLAQIDPKNPEDHLHLAEWAMKAKLWEAAKKELEDALALRKDYRRAELLLREVEGQIKAAEGAATRPETGGTEGTTVRPSPGTGTATIQPEWLVGEEDINRIRLAELQVSDTNIIVKFRNDAVDRFLKKVAGRGDFQQPRAADQFRALPPAHKAIYMLLTGHPRIDRDDTALKDDVRILKDPQVMAIFRSDVWPILSQYCAGASCHGGEKLNGNYKLFNVGTGSDNVVYTNFLILDGYAKKGGPRMINRDRPEQSLLLQLGLPPEQAQMRHPKSIPAAFNSREAANYRKVHAWIRSLRAAPHPDDRLEWKPPFGMTLDFGAPQFDFGSPAPPATQPAGGGPAL